jgi:hypothetical protein
MPAKPDCVNCGHGYAYHKWAAGTGECKYPKGAAKTVYREPGTPIPPQPSAKAVA